MNNMSYPLPDFLTIGPIYVEIIIIIIAFAYFQQVTNFISVKFEASVVMYRASWNILLEKLVSYVDWDP